MKRFNIGNIASIIFVIICNAIFLGYTFSIIDHLTYKPFVGFMLLNLLLYALNVIFDDGLIFEIDEVGSYLGVVFITIILSAPSIAFFFIIYFFFP